MYTDPRAPGPHELEGVTELASRVVVDRATHGGPGLGQPAHAPGVGAVGGDLPAARELDVGEKTLVAPHERAANPRIDRQRD